MRPGRLLTIALVLLLAGPASLLAQTRASSAIPDDVQVDTQIEFARYGSRILKLDLYRPANASLPIPVIVLVAGGGYDSADTQATLIEAVAMAKRGLAALAIEYRGPAEQEFPAAVHDVKAAVRWAKANAHTFGFDADAVGVMGGSFGGQLASYVAVTAGIDELEGLGGNSDFSSAVYAATAFSALTALTDLPRNTKGIVKDFIGGWDFFHRKKWRFASPVTHAGPDSPPLLLMAAQNDPGVPASQSIRLAKAYEEAGALVEMEILADAIHPFWTLDPWHEYVMDTAARFFFSHAGSRE